MASFIAPGESSSKKFQWKYDVFLSFRGQDTRKNFTDHLYAALCRKGIVIYKDDPNLEKGQKVLDELLHAIENSKYLVVIISRNYAYSTWCLEELVKIVECMKGGEQMATPIFYEVDPSNVRKQQGSFQSAFNKHEAIFKDDIDKVQRWKNAMKEIANLSGWSSRDRPEWQFIQDVVEDLQIKLGKKLFYAPKNLVGIESRLEDMFLRLSFGSNDVRFIGISGMGGIGKSTLARVVFDEINAQFEGSSFLANIREVSNTLGLRHLQKKLLFDVLREKDLMGDVIVGAGVIAERLKHKKVLVVLDDVDQIDQLENLAGKSYFGLGSRIIITTRHEHLLLIHGVHAVYKAKELSNKEALELFCSRAFGENNPPKEFTNFPKRVIGYAKGLPLALTVLGSFLFGRSMIEWQNALDRLQNNPFKQIFETLRLSFDRLEETEKAIFLDIACFFSGEDKDHVMGILDSCGFYPEIGVKFLIEKSLLTVIDNKFMMHDLLREMAWEVVRQESPEEPGKRSRLWLHNDVNHVLLSNTGTERIEGIVLYPKFIGREYVNADCIHKMINLRLLVLPETIGVGEVKCLSNKLRLLSWDGFPSSYLPTNFMPGNLYALKMPCSHLKQPWRSQKIFEKLKHIDLEGSKYLEGTPDFMTIPNLEKLILRDCEKLSQIHPNIGIFYKLKFLDLSNCKNLRKLPPGIGCLSSLEHLDLSGCHLQEGGIPNDLGCLFSLRYLDLSSNDFITIPESINQIPHLESLSLNNCVNLQALPSLPESILYVQVENCMKLNTISNLFIICTKGEDISFFNCLQFLPEELEIPSAQKYSLALLCHIIGCSEGRRLSGQAYVVAPNCEIPEWITYKMDGSLLRFRIRGLNFKYEATGFIICVSFLRQEQESSDSKHVKCSHDLICEFYASGNQFGPSFPFPIRFITSNCLWMGFVDLRDFGLDANWEGKVYMGQRINVSLRTLDEQLKVIKCGILPLRHLRLGTFNKLVESASTSLGDLSSIVHDELEYQKVVYYHFSRSGDNEERDDHFHFHGCKDM